MFHSMRFFLFLAVQASKPHQVSTEGITVLHIREARESDWPSVKSIYEEGIATGNATFASVAPDSYGAWQANSVPGCSLVAELDGCVVGWCKLTKTSDQCVYAGVGEVSIYIGQDHRGKGVGHALLRALIEVSEQRGFWTLVSKIFPENQASVRLHLKNGFRIIGTCERIGKMNGVWRDVLLLERRSEIVGID